MVGIAEVARRAGVSQATASRALTGRGSVSAATRERVEQVARELGYVASTNAASLVTGRTQNIGVVMPVVNRWFFSEVLEGVQDALLERHYDLTLYDARPGSAGRDRIFRFFLARKRFDGLIAAGLEPSDHELEKLVTFGKPVVSIGGYDVGTSAIVVDDFDVARRATEHLIALGHRRIAMVGGDADERRAPRVDRARLTGYLETMSAAGLSDHARHAPSAVSLPGGYAAAVDLLGDARTRPSAIVAACDEVAIGSMIAARRQGIQVPGDLSVIGIDDHEFAEMFSLTTFAQQPRRQGSAAAELLIAHIEQGEPAPTRVTHAVRLIVRSSTAAPRA